MTLFLENFSNNHRFKGSPRCIFDSLTIVNGDSTYNTTFCNRYNNVGDYFEEYYEFYELEFWAEFEDLQPGEPVIIPGNSISITFKSDDYINHSGFHLSVTPSK